MVVRQSRARMVAWYCGHGWEEMGDLCKHLECIAACSNTSLYIKRKADKCGGLFPSSYVG